MDIRSEQSEVFASVMGCSNHWIFFPCTHYSWLTKLRPGFLLRIFVKGAKCRVAPAVGGHGNCGARSLEEGVGVLHQKLLDF